MKAEEYLKNKGLDPDKIGKEEYYVDCTTHKDLLQFMKQYANQRVIEELEALKLCNGVGMDLEIIIDDIIKQLKQ